MAASPITCHVLNTLSGTPAANLGANLTLLSRDPNLGEAGEGTIGFLADTDKDGRVQKWEPLNDLSIEDLMGKFPPGARMAWSIRFNVGRWYEAQEIESFWPEIEVKFYAQAGNTRHCHVPVLVGPFSYTTYRGS